MNVVIFGAGELGSYLATSLSEENQRITLIDKNEAVLSRYAQRADIATLSSAKARWDVLDEIPNKDKTIFIGMTRQDEVNLVGCTIAKNLGFAKTIARVSQRTFLDRCHLDFSSLFHVDHFVAPELIISSKLMRKILHPESITTEFFKNGLLEMLTLAIPHNATKRDIPEGARLCLISREGELHFPTEKLEIFPGDEATFVGKRNVIDKLPSHFGAEQRKVDSVVLCGGAYIGKELCPLLLDQKIKVKVIESDNYQSRQLSENIPGITVLHNEETDYDLYLEERVGESDVFIGATEKTEKNILAASLAQECGSKNVFCLTNDRSYFHLLDRLEIKHLLSARMSVANHILSILYGGNIVQVVSLYDNQAKLLEMRISEGSQLLDKKFSALFDKLPQDCSIILIESDGETFPPDNEHTFRAGDTAMLITTPANMSQLEKLFL